MTQFLEQRLTTLITLDRCGMLPEMDRLLEKYFEENLDFYQEFNVAPVPLHFNQMKEHGFDQTISNSPASCEGFKVTFLRGLF
jgi:predicted amidophosphoribosyltransferase